MGEPLGWGRKVTWMLLCGMLMGAAPMAWCLSDGQALTPPMGWNSWNKFGGGMTEAKFKAIADAFVTNGLKDAGYKYLVVDDGWLEAGRDAAGALIPVSKNFPAGMKALGDYAHSKGLKFGMYQCPTLTTCQHKMGSFGHEKEDARQLASYGIDFLKYDWCGVQSGEDAAGVSVAEVKRRYVAMRDALKATGRPIVYSMSEKGQGTKGVVPGTWSDTVAHMWRIGHDIHTDWASVVSHASDNAGIPQYTAPGGWNDPDMLEVGNGTLTVAENRSHFSLWCIMASPLILGNDPSAMTDSVKAIVINREAIAIDQDSLGRQGHRIRGKGALEVWVKELRGGEKAVLLFNATAATADIRVDWKDSLILWDGAAVDVREIWSGREAKAAAGGYTSRVASHDAVLLRLRNPAVTSLSRRLPQKLSDGMRLRAGVGYFAVDGRFRSASTPAGAVAAGRYLPSAR